MQEVSGFWFWLGLRRYSDQRAENTLIWRRFQLLWDGSIRAPSDDAGGGRGLESCGFRQQYASKTMVHSAEHGAQTIEGQSVG